MRRTRILFALLLSLAALPAAAQSAPADSVPVTAPSSVGSATHGVPPTPRRSPMARRAKQHVLAAYVVGWGLLLGYLVLLVRRFRRLGKDGDGLAGA